MANVTSLSNIIKNLKPGIESLRFTFIKPKDFMVSRPIKGGTLYKHSDNNLYLFHDNPYRMGASPDNFMYNPRAYSKKYNYSWYIGNARAVDTNSASAPPNFLVKISNALMGFKIL